MLQKSFLLSVFLLAFIFTGWAQKIVGYSSVYDDRLDQWKIEVEGTDEEGMLECTWASMGDWSEWEYSFGHQSGWIRPRRKEDPNIWEVRGDGQILEIRTIFPFEFDRWQVRYRTKTYDVKMFRRDPEQWLVKTNQGEIFFYTYHEGDLRDWVLENDADFPFVLQIALTFVPILKVMGAGG